MYFAILWKNIEISKKELEHPTIKDLKVFWNFYASFESESLDLLNKLWWIIKRWQEFNSLDEINELLANKDHSNPIYNNLNTEPKILWINRLDEGKEFKQKLWIRRFKVVKEQSTDLEIKKKWIEIITKWWKFLLVLWYQNIDLYEKIDFKKPSRSMSMWMMPAKLAHILINIALNNLDTKNKTLIYDPFAGSWTTWMLANYFNLDMIMSDIDIFHLHRNIQWRREQTDFTDAHTYYFKHDIQENINLNTFQKFQKYNIALVTEWRLGPIVGKNTTLDKIKDYQKQVSKLYKSFLNTVKDLSKYSNWDTTSVFTIPYYTQNPRVNYLEDELKNYWEKIWLQVSSIDELYKRKGQYIARKILFIR